VLKEVGVGIPVGDPARFKDQLKQLLLQLPKEKRTGPEVLKEVKGLMAKQNIVIPEDKENADLKIPVRDAQLNREVRRLLDPREAGYIGEHRALVKRILDIEAEIHYREKDLAVLNDQAKERREQLDKRTKHEKEILDKLVAARAESQRLAGELRRLQDQ